MYHPRIAIWWSWADFDEFLDMMTAKMSAKDSREDILKVFKLFDDDGTGRISLENLRRVARELGEEMSEVCIVLTDHMFLIILLFPIVIQEELKEMITRADLDGDGQINADEFYNIMTKKTFQ